MISAGSHLPRIVLECDAAGVCVACGFDVGLCAYGGRSIGRRAFYAIGAIVEPSGDADGQQQEYEIRY